MQPPKFESPAMFTAWLVVALLVPVALLNYLDRQMLATMKFSVVKDIPGITEEVAWGTILANFKWTYAFLSPIGGYLADRLGKRYVIAGSLFAWSLITWLTGQVETYDQLLWTRTLMGVSEAFYIPAALALIADFHLGPTRSRAVGWHQFGIYLGQIIGGFGGFVADDPRLGWRWAFAACGLVGVLYSVPLLFLLPTPPIAERKEAGRSPLSALGSLAGNFSFYLLVLYFTLPALAGWIVRDWMPAVLKKEFNLGQGTAGVSATLFWQIAAICGAIAGGWLADRLIRHSTR